MSLSQWRAILKSNLDPEKQEQTVNPRDLGFGVLVRFHVCARLVEVARRQMDQSRRVSLEG